MKIYLDVSCLNRPFNDQAQPRIRLETEAIGIVFLRCDQGEWQHASSQIAGIEIDAMPDVSRRRKVRLFLPKQADILSLAVEHYARAAELQSHGFKAADALHIACAESQEADVLLTCDDRLCRLAKRRRAQLQVRVANPVDWLREQVHDADA